MSELTIKHVRDAIHQVRDGFWYTPKYPTKYKRKRVYHCDSCESECCGCNDKGKYWYDKVPVRWRKGKKKFHEPMNPMAIITGLKDKNSKGDSEVICQH